MTARDITLYGGPPWGFRMSGGSDVGSKLRIIRVSQSGGFDQRQPTLFRVGDAGDAHALVLGPDLLVAHLGAQVLPVVAGRVLVGAEPSERETRTLLSTVHGSARSAWCTFLPASGDR